MTARRQPAGPLPDSLEIVRPRRRTRAPRVALFDFDGTLSLIREGWQNVMIPMMVEVLAEQPRAESRADIESVVRNYVTDLTGRQTVYQMIRLAEEVSLRGGTPREPLDYKREYLRRLDERIADRVHGLETGALAPGNFLVPGALEIIEELSDSGIALYCASGTDESCARHEADLLGVSRFFVGGVRGAVDDYKHFSKQIVVRSLISECGLVGEELVVAGDGFVEIGEGRAVDALTVGVASDEAALLSGADARLRRAAPWQAGADAWKRSRLIAAGADVIVPDFRDAQALVDWLFGV